MFLVIDCPFNHQGAPTLIGKLYAKPPSYVQVRRV